MNKQFDSYDCYIKPENFQTLRESSFIKRLTVHKEQDLRPGARRPFVRSCIWLLLYKSNIFHNVRKEQGKYSPIILNTSSIRAGKFIHLGQFNFSCCVHLSFLNQSQLYISSNAHVTMSVGKKYRRIRSSLMQEFTTKGARIQSIDRNQ